MKHLTFILGGRDSGKSKFAIKHGQTLGEKKYLLATAQALDENMVQQIELCKSGRPSDWNTIEESIKVPDVVGFLHKRADVVVIDCVSLWLSNLLIVRSDYDIKREAELLIETIKRVDFSVVVVSNEVGCGIVPPDPVSRLFSDTLGPMHQKLSALSNEVYFMVAGRPLRVP